MTNDKDGVQNRPSEKGRDNDPNVRDETATQPGVSTISESKTDADNQTVTNSAMDYPAQTNFDADTNADPTFDEIENKKNL